MYNTGFHEVPRSAARATETVGCCVWCLASPDKTQSFLPYLEIDLFYYDTDRLLAQRETERFTMFESSYLTLFMFLK